MDERVVIGYMCLTDWKYELGEAMGGNRIFPDVEDLKENSPCWKQCGIAEVEVRMTRVVVDATF